MLSHLLLLSTVILKAVLTKDSVKEAVILSSKHTANSMEDHRVWVYGCLLSEASLSVIFSWLVSACVGIIMHLVGRGDNRLFILNFEEFHQALEILEGIKVIFFI